MIRRQGKSRYLTNEERKSVINNQTGKLHQKRNVCILTLLSLTGCRVGEITSLDMVDVLEPDGSVKDEWVLKKQNTKRGKSQKLYINPILKKSVEEHLNHRREKGDILTPSTPLFMSQVNRRFTNKSIQMLVKKMCVGIGLKNEDMISSHSFRRTHITNLFRSGVDVKTISTLVNHSNIHITDGYIQNDEVRLKKVVNDLRL